MRGGAAERVVKRHACPVCRGPGTVTRNSGGDPRFLTVRCNTCDAWYPILVRGGVESRRLVKPGRDTCVICTWGILPEDVLCCEHCGAVMHRECAVDGRYCKECTTHKPPKKRRHLPQNWPDPPPPPPPPPVRVPDWSGLDGLLDGGE